MRIDDLSAFIQAHKLVSGRSCPEFVPSDLGVGCAYFNALQTARRIHSENASAPSSLPICPTDGEGTRRLSRRKHGMKRHHPITPKRPLEAENGYKAGRNAFSRKPLPDLGLQS